VFVFSDLCVTVFSAARVGLPTSRETGNKTNRLENYPNIALRSTAGGLPWQQQLQRSSIHFSKLICSVGTVRSKQQTGRMKVVTRYQGESVTAV